MPLSFSAFCTTDRLAYSGKLNWVLIPTCADRASPGAKDSNVVASNRLRMALLPFLVGAWGRGKQCTETTCSNSACENSESCVYNKTHIGCRKIIQNCVYIVKPNRDNSQKNSMFYCLIQNF